MPLHRSYRSSFHSPTIKISCLLVEKAWQSAILFHISLHLQVGVEGESGSDLVTFVFVESCANFECDIRLHLFFTTLIPNFAVITSLSSQIYFFF